MFNLFTSAMKTNIFKSLLLAFVAAAGISCTNEADIPDTASESLSIENAAYEASNRPDYWEGVIGVFYNGAYQIVVDEGLLISDLEDIMARQGEPVALHSIAIVEKTANNDHNDTAYFLVAGNDDGISVGVMLRRQANSFTLDKQIDQPVVAVSCIGCASGCNLEYLYLQGKKIPICNVNGCIYDCKKAESELN